MAGTVVRLFSEAGYGFIETADADEYDFGEENVIAPALDQPKEGDEVHFIADLSADTPQAKRISLGRQNPPSW